MKKHLEKIPFLLFSLFLFITLPITYYIFDNSSQVLIILLLIIFPLINFTISLLFSYYKEDFSYSFSILIGIFYFSTCLILLNFDIAIYAIIYILASLCGQGTGFIFKKFFNTFKKDKKKISE
ncbi:hypothetical protein HZY83_07160 [Gemella sp. GH3]|uniref:hypothetical protein n=1 Tax=unclassified Gemella TaxID=2624949 RepID=UPI0015D035E8|nr:MULTISPECIES: hypothetical protein [unclassified Gemella]MBF0714452.1 hypothetical protein [Gemella sp. GH3.1]NYS51404.1 hypothetical protein [Gemella sp. GH3]